MNRIDTSNSPTALSTALPHILPPLPYTENALQPVITAKTIRFHYGKHHQGYVGNLNKLIAGTEYSGLTLEEIIAVPKGRRKEARSSITPHRSGTIGSIGKV